MSLAEDRLRGKSVREIVAQSNGKFDGLTAFYLHDTLGFHIDALQFLAEHRGWTVDRNEFNRLMSAAREKSRLAMIQEQASVLE
jgi:alanyl-tRNA synthetase